MRRELFALHLPNPELVKANLRTLADQSQGLSSGDILNSGILEKPAKDSGLFGQTTTSRKDSHVQHVHDKT